MLAERFRCTQAVGHLKAAYGLPPADPSREAEQIARLRRLADDANLDPDFAEKFLNFIIREVIRHHEAIARRKRRLAETVEQFEEETEMALKIRLARAGSKKRPYYHIVIA